MTAPICPVCNRPIKKSPQECPHCHIVYHPNCWRQVTYCTTCGLRNPEREDKDKKKVYVKAGEAVTIHYNELVSGLHGHFSAPGSALIAVGIFLYLFRKASSIYLLLVAIGLGLILLSWLIHLTGRARHVVSPSTRCIQRTLSVLGLSFTLRLMGFDDIVSFRIEGEQRFKGNMKGIPSYFYNAYWVVSIDKLGNHIRLSDEIRTDRDPSYVSGSEYEFGGLYPLAQKAGAVVGVDVYVAPNIRPYRIVPLLWKVSFFAAIVSLAWLLL